MSVATKGQQEVSLWSPLVLNVIEGPISLFLSLSLSLFLSLSMSLSQDTHPWNPDTTP